MARASAQAWLPGRSALAYGTLLLGGLLLVAASDGAAQSKAPDKDAKAPAKDKDKKDDKGKVDVKTPFLRKTALHGKSDADVAEMTKVINDKLAAAWKENNVIHADSVSDHEFIRRVSLDIIGRIATPEEVHKYLKYPELTRRSQIIDDLLASDEYPRHWANLWANWLLSRSGLFGAGRYHEDLQKWLQKQFALNRHYDQIVKELITASGKNDEHPEVNFILAHVGEPTVDPANRAISPEERQKRIEKDGQFEMVPITSRITRLFLGTQVQCAQCHDHPFRGDLKQEMFWGVNAFLRQVQREGQLQMRRQDGLLALTLKDNEGVNTAPAVYYEKRNGVIIKQWAQFLPNGDQKTGPAMERDVKGNNRRQELARFLMDHDNFPKAIVNRMWGVFFGRGFTNPIDDFNDQNQPSNPELLNALAGRFKHYGYDQKKLIRWICNSDAYGLSCVANATNDKPEQEALFSRQVMKAMSPEQLFESLIVATRAEVGDKGNEAERARLKAEWLSKLVSQFGDDEGNEVNFNGTVVQALMMMNGDDINKNIARPKDGTVAQAVAMHPGQPSAIIRELFLATLNREPTGKEVQALVQKFPLLKVKDKDAAAPYQDLFWALLNSSEFLLNH
jgi:hypothetical protein